MIAKWWNHYDEWQLIVLQPTGCWVPLAIVKFSERTQKYSASMCITSGGSGSTWMGSSIRTLHSKRCAAFFAAERMCGFQKRVNHVSWIPIHVRGWNYPPCSKHNKQKMRAALYAESLKNFLCLTSDLLTQLGQACKATGNKLLFNQILVDISKAELWKAQEKLNSLNQQEALCELQRTFSAFKSVREKMHHE